MSQLTPSHFRNHGAYDDVEILRAYDRVAIAPMRLRSVPAPDAVEQLEALFPPLPEPRAPAPGPGAFVRPPAAKAFIASAVPVTATWRNGEHIVVCFDLPGVDARALRVSLVGETLEVWFEVPRRAG